MKWDSKPHYKGDLIIHEEWKKLKSSIASKDAARTHKSKNARFHLSWICLLILIGVAAFLSYFSTSG